MSDVKITQAAPARGSRRRRVRLFLVLGALFLLVGYVGLDLWAGHLVNVEVARLETRYGPIDEYPLVSARVPPSENRARVVRAAVALVDFGSAASDGNVADAYRGLMNAPTAGPVPTTLRNFIEANRSGLRLADEARTRSRSSWEMGYEYGGAVPPLLEIRGLSNATYVAALMDLEVGRPDDASRSITTGLAVSSSLRQEPSLIAQLIRIAIGMQQLEGVHRLVTQSEPSKTSLEELAKWLAEDDAPDPAGMGVVSEMKTFNAALTRLGNGRSVTSDSLLRIGPLARLGRPVIRLAQARYLRRMEGLLDAQAGPRPRPTPVLAPPRWAWLARFDNSAGLVRSIDTCDRFNSALGATELAVALRRFRLDHGTYPDDLQALVPVYMASVPIDAFTGHPPMYTRQGDGFHLRADGAQQSQKAYSSWIVSAFDWVVPK